MRIITAFSGTIMILVAVWCYINVGSTFLSLAFIIGVSMVIQALSGICSYIGARNDFSKTSWILTDSLATGIMGAIVLANMLTMENTIMAFFAAWVMFSGLQRTVASAHMMELHEKGWLYALILGAVTLLYGIYGFFNPVLLALDAMFYVSLAFLIQGANVITLAVNMQGKYKIIPHETKEEKPMRDFTFAEGSDLAEFEFEDVAAKIDDAAEEALEDTLESLAKDIEEDIDEGSVWDGDVNNLPDADEPKWEKLI